MNLFRVTVCSALLLLCGCASMGGWGGSGTIDEINLFGVPVALNLDSNPGVDGIGIRIYASSASAAKGREIAAGRLDVMIFEQMPADPATAQPLHSWSFSAAELKAYEGKTSLGIGYRLALNWEQDKPKSKSLTVYARYSPPRGPSILSPPSTIALFAK